MFKRRVPLVAALSPLAAALLMMAPVNADAVELGTLSLQSASGQPLQATIALSDVEGLNAADVRVELASADDFQRFSLERLAALETLQIAVDFSGAAPVLRLSSPVTINEPFLSLVLDTRWPAGRVLTEYMVRLESPAFSSGSALTSSAPVRTENVPLTSADETQESADIAVSNAPVTISNASTITVNAGDTLWELAQRVRPDSSVSVQQTMLALQNLNPQAFINGNINRVRRGEVLQVPELNEIRRITSAEAVAEVSRQNREFASGSAQPAPIVAPPSSTAAYAGAQGELRVVTVAEDSDSQTASAGGSGNRTTPLTQQIESLEDRIALREEELARFDVQNEELSARLALLQQQIAAAQEIIRLRDLELAQLQQQLAQEGPAVSTPAVEPPVITMAPDAGPVQRILHTLTSNTWAMLAAAGLLVLLLVLLMGWRNRSAALAKAQANARENESITLGADDDELLFTGVSDSAADKSDGADSSEELTTVTGAAAYQAIEDEANDSAESDFDAMMQQELQHSSEFADDAEKEAESTADQQRGHDDWQPDELEAETSFDDFSDDVFEKEEDPIAFGETDPSQLDSKEDDLGVNNAEFTADFDLDAVEESETGADLSWPDEERFVDSAEAITESITETISETAAETDVETDAFVGDEFDISLTDDVEVSAEPVVIEPTPTARKSIINDFDDLAFLPAEDEFTDQALAAADDDDDDFDFLSDTDEAATKLDLARAYIDMGDSEGAREILDEVLKEGTAEQRKDAQELLGRL